jgi:hypothetical protein
MNQNSTEEVKYCVAAFLDLQGFSHHLEVSSDIRTTIGQQAIRRLETLEKMLKFLHEEQQKMAFSFPNKRINDSIILTTDLNDALLPNIGETYREALSESEWERLYDIKPIRLDRFPVDWGDSDEAFNEKYERKRREYTLALLKFVGLVSRMHQRITYEEYKNNFPGIKTIISTGFRRRFFGYDDHEDHFSANFAFSNAYKAQESLRGCGLFLDNHVLEMMDADLRTKNIARFTCLRYQNSIYSPLKDPEEPDPELVPSDPVEVSLFRKNYYFRRVNPVPLTYLQFIDELEDRDEIRPSIVESLKGENILERIKQGDHFLILKMPYDLGKKLKAESQQPELPKCSKCRYELVPNAKYCVNCGEAIPQEA